MYKNKKIGVIIPAFNEEESITNVIGDVPDCVDIIIIVDNNSNDLTAEKARAAGAVVEFQPLRGYGNACLKGIERIVKEKMDIIVFLDGDYSDYPEELLLLIEPIISDNNELVIGSRTRGNKQKGAMLLQAVVGNWLATALIRLIWGYSFTDLGPFRAITFHALEKINMNDTTYGWTVEMQIKAAQYKLRATEVPVSYRQRIGKSKITGTISGTIKASYKILWTIFRYALRK
jgi:glycosyltransferase involved in cell wall biosynthesis